jgi:hypothetical protein
MKKALTLLFVILMGLIILNRERVFVRDPLATVYRSPTTDPAGAVKQTGVQVYINYSNDVLLLREDEPERYNLLLQHWNQTPGTPVQMRCIHWMACLTDADHAALIALPSLASDPKVQMTDREVSFNAQGARFRVLLR